MGPIRTRAPALRADAAPREAPGIRELLVRLVLFVYVPALLAAIAVVGLQARSDIDAAQDEVLERAVTLSRAMRFRLEAIQSHLERLADEIPADGDWHDFDERARRTAFAAGVDGIVVLRAGGEQVVNTRFNYGTPLPPAPEVFLRSVRTGRVVFNDAATGPLTGKLLVGVAVPVIRNGQVLYSVTAAIEVSRLQELLALTPDGWLSAIVDAKGIIIARTPRPDLIVGRTATGDLREHLGKEEQAVLHTVTLDNVPVLTAFRTPPSIGWTAVVSVPRATLYAPVLRRAAYLAAAAIGLLALALWFAGRLRRSIVRSIEALVDEAMEVREQRHDQALSFQEAVDLRRRLRQSRAELTRAQRTAERLHREFHRTLMQQMDRRQAQIAGELHDDVGSSLVAISLLLGTLRPKVKPAGLPLLENVHQQVARTAESVRRLSRGIMPAGHEEGGLVAALEQLASDVSQVDRVECSFQWRGDFSLVAADAAAHLFRIAQEALANALRHGGASRVRIWLARAGSCCRLTIDDDGTPWQAEALAPAREGMGLRSMRARAMAMVAVLEFMPSPMGGWRVRVCWQGADSTDRPAAQEARGEALMNG